MSLRMILRSLAFGPRGLIRRSGPAVAGLAVAGWIAALPALAQDPPQPGPPLAAPAATGAQPSAVVPSPVVTLDQERFFRGSRYGAAVQGAIEREATALLAENRRIEAALETEERALTVRRTTLTPEEFAPLAEEFDRKVERIRAQQETKSRELTLRLDSERQKFTKIALPLLAELLAERGAVAVLSNDAVVLSLSALDITDLAIARVDERLPVPEGTAGTTPDAGPDATPETAPETAPETLPATTPDQPEAASPP